MECAGVGGGAVEHGGFAGRVGDGLPGAEFVRGDLGHEREPAVDEIEDAVDERGVVGEVRSGAEGDGGGEEEEKNVTEKGAVGRGSRHGRVEGAGKKKGERRKKKREGGRHRGGN
jgi:hypothetical protein